MGLDIYAGTFTRYYSHNWKTAVQQWAEENGYTFSRISPDGDPIDDGEEDPEDIRQAVVNWRDQILSAAAQANQTSYLPWNEDHITPYYTDKPDWDAFGALLLYTSCTVYGEPVPAAVQKGWDFASHPAIQRLAEDPGRVWSLFRSAVCWLPVEDGFLFEAPLPVGGSAVIATTGGLKKELDKINRLCWQAGEDTILSWTETEGYPADAVISADGIFSKDDIPECTQYHTESLAKFAYSILWRALRFSMETQVPILLDY